MPQKFKLSFPCSDINDKQRRLAEITEMIHTASLVHDDVVDDCDTRRGMLSDPHYDVESLLLKQIMRIQNKSFKPYDCLYFTTLSSFE